MGSTLNTRTKILTQSPIKLLVSMSLPAVIGMVVVGLYSFMDAMYIGQMVGETQMGAISIAYPFTFINSGIATLIGIGSASILSRAIGKKDNETINKIMGNLIMTILILSVIVTVMVEIFARQILSLTGASGDILDYATRYIRITYIGSLFVNFMQSANMVMRGEGLLKEAMLIMGAGAVLNIILDPIFIYLLRDSDKGIEGAAIATVITQIIQAIVTLWYFLKKSKVVKIHKIRIEKSILKEVIAIGFSAMLMQVTTLLQQTVTYNVAAQYGGDTGQILLGAALRYSAFAFIPLWGIAQGFQPVAGTNYGAKQFNRLKKMTKVFITGATVLALFFYIPCMLFPDKILSIFIPNQAIVAQGADNFRIMFSTYITLGFFIISITLFQAIGRAAKAGIISICRQIVLFIPLVLLLPRFMNLGMTGIWITPVVTDVIILIIEIVMLITEFKRIDKMSKEYN